MDFLNSTKGGTLWVGKVSQGVKTPTPPPPPPPKSAPVHRQKFKHSSALMQSNYKLFVSRRALEVFESPLRWLKRPSITICRQNPCCLLNHPKLVTLNPIKQKMISAEIFFVNNKNEPDSLYHRDTTPWIFWLLYIITCRGWNLI